MFNKDWFHIAYGEKNEILFGAVYNPFAKEMYFAEKGKGSYCNNQKLTLPKREKDHHMLFGTGPANTTEYSQKNLETLLAIKPLPHFRAFGAAAQEIAWIAAGKLDVYVHSNLMPWDLAAGYLIVQEAGGIGKSFSGEEATFLTPDAVVGTEQYVIDIISQLNP